MAYTKSLDPLNNHQLHRGTLTADDVVTLRQRHAAGLSTVREQADAYGVSPETIRRAIRGETWRHLQIKPNPDAGLNVTDAAAASLERLLAVPGIAAKVEPDAVPPVLTIEPERSKLDQAPVSPVSTGGALALPAHYPVEPSDPAAG